MCGIGGYSFKSGSVYKSNILIDTQNALAHRGPDDYGFYKDPEYNIGLVHTRLSILDLSHQGHQPMISDNGQVVIVFNGEIYNFQELRADLELHGHSFRGQSDTEVLLHLYLAQSSSGDLSEAGLTTMLRRLNGIFAFAIWDGNLQSLLLVRDALGVKPLYYQISEIGLSFGSEIKALPSIPFTLDAEALNRYLTFLWCPGEGTPAESVRKMGPGDAMWVKEGVVVDCFTWYKLPFFQPRTKFLQKKFNLSKVDAIKGTENHLRQAVHRQMVSDVPVGAFLSGGLDSSSIVAFAREKNSDIQCFTIEAKGLVEEGITNDLPYARRVAKHLNVQLEVVSIDASRMASDLPAMVEQLDEPLADPASLNVLYISRLAREHGIKVLLSGTGGDDLFTGYRRHRALMSENLWSWLPKPVLVGLEQLTSGLNQNRPLFRRFRKLLNGAQLDGDERLVNYFRWVDQRDLNALYSSEFRAALGDARAADPMLTFLAGLPSETSKLDRMLALEKRFFLTDHNLIYTDKMSMAEGVEVRVPFLDLDLVEFASQIPDHFKQCGSEGKWVLKKAMESYLPLDIIYRPKSGFGAPLRHWMRFELRELLSDLLSDGSLRKRGLFDPKSVQNLIQANHRGEIDGSYTLLSLICIELWCRRFLDKTEHLTHSI